MANTVARWIDVAAGIARRADGAVLIALRPKHKVRGDQWEFPGGKLEPGESPEQALEREWREELGNSISVLPGGYQLTHCYPDISVRLHVFPVQMVGAPVPQEGQTLRWVPPDALRSEEFVAADRYVLTRLRLPTILIISQVAELGLEGWLAALGRALKSGVRFVQLREHWASDTEYEALAQATLHLCRTHAAHLVFNRTPEWLAGRAAGGLHVTAAVLARLRARPVPSSQWFGASCHNEAELDHAFGVGADYATLAPVAATATHPGAVPMGWPQWAESVRGRALPVLAQGGLGPADLGHAQSHGAHGIAFLRATKDYPALPS